MSERAQTRAGWLAVLACALTALLPDGGLALCFGHDGHIGLGTASALSDDCPCEHPVGDRAERRVGDQAERPSGDRAEHPSDDRAPPGDRHPPCDDLSFAQPPVCAPRDNAAAPAVTVTWPVPCAAQSFDGPVLRDLDRWRWQPRALPCGSTLRHRRTVVLLI